MLGLCSPATERARAHLLCACLSNLCTCVPQTLVCVCYSLQPESRFLHVLDLIRNGTFGWADFFAPLCASVTGAGDFYLLANDFPSYLDAQERIDAAYRDQDKWTRMSILSTAGTGKFSSDRTIREYADEIWNVQPQPRPKP